MKKWRLVPLPKLCSQRCLARMGVVLFFVAGFGGVSGFPFQVWAEDSVSEDVMPRSAGAGPENVEAAIKALSSGVVSRGTAEIPRVPVILERSIQFSDVKGEVVILEEGNYLVEISETPPLKLYGEVGNKNWKLTALPGTHEESITGPEAESVQGVGEDEHHLLLLLPGGKSVDATGSYTGIGTRSTASLRAAILKKKRAALAKKRKARASRKARRINKSPAKSLPGRKIPIVGAKLKFRPLIAKPLKSQFYTGLFRDQVTLKFKEGAPVRIVKTKKKTPKPAFAFAQNLFDAKSQSLLQKGKLTKAKVDTDLGKINQVMKRPTIKGVVRLFSRAESFLKNERAKAEKTTGSQHADLNNYYKIQLKPGQKGEELVDELNALSSVEVAYLAPIPEDADIPPVTPNFQGNQGYLGAAPGGIDAQFAWTFPGGRGQGIRVIDIEGNWNLQHEDLRSPFFTDGVFISGQDHGTAVLGEMVARNDGVGVTGIASDSTYGVVSVVRLAGILGHSASVADALNVAASRLSRGDVILIEQHSKGPASGQTCTTCNCDQFEYIAMEFWPDVYDAVKAATSRGIIVVEAAGNGGMNLDAGRYNNVFNRNFRDSGAIVVGASNGSRTPTCWTNRGSRVDVHGWGQNVWTTGYGDGRRVNGDDARQWYTRSFSGTSSASPIVAGAVMSLMGIRKAAGIDGMDPIRLRTLLRNTGTPQRSLASGQIGPLPDLRTAIGQLSLEDCVGLNPNSIQAIRKGNNWFVEENSHTLLAFGTNRSAAERARDTIRHYGMNKTCYIGRPGPSFTYWLAGNLAPTGSFSGEDCLPMNPSLLEVKRIGASWKIVQGNEYVESFGNKQNEANAALNIIKRYDFKRQCFVKRPNAQMTYWRR